METVITFLHRWTPSQARKLWLVIDSIVVIWSILLLVELLTTLAPNLRLEGERAYLVYNFGTTLIWVVACDLHLLDHYIKYHRQQRQVPQDSGEDQATNVLSHESQESSEKKLEDIRFLIFEGIMALYFLYDSVNVYKKWRNPDEDDVVEVQVLAVVINAASFAYQVIRVLSLPMEDYTELPSVQSTNV